MSTLRSVLSGLAWLAIAAPVLGQSSTDSVSRLTLEINLPAFRVDARIDTVPFASFPVAVGMRQYPTQLGDYSISEVLWNPWWNPPDSWWARNDTLTPPGPGNPMGKVKMSLGGLLFMHGTSAPQSIGKAASHACIRMRNQDAVTLARLVQLHGGATLSEATLDTILRQWNPTVRVPLATPVTVHVVYRLVELRGDQLLFHADIYRRGRDSVETDALSLLASAGYDTTAVDRSLLQRLARESSRASLAVKISELLMPATVRLLPTRPSARPDSRAEPACLS